MKRCTQCDRSFKPRNGRQLTCSPDCAEARHRGKIKERRAGLLKKVGFSASCMVCGASFLTRSHNQKYCGKEDCKAEGLKRAVLAQKARRIQQRICGGKEV